jgi:hypothetical protein
VVAIVTVIFGAFSFLLSNFDSLRMSLIWRDSVEVLSLAPGSTSVANTGDGPVYVSDIHIEGNIEGLEKFSKTYSIEKVVNPGGVIVFKPPDYVLEKYRTFFKGDRWVQAEAKSKEETRKKLLESSSLGSAFRAHSAGDKVCFIRNYTVENNPGYLRNKRFLSDSLLTFPVKADIGIYSIKTKSWKRSPIKVIGSLSERYAKECKF